MNPTTQLRMVAARMAARAVLAATSKPSEGTASAQRINAAPIPVRCDFGGICNRDHGAQCAAVCRRQRGGA